MTVDEVNRAPLASPEVFRAELVEFNEHFRVTSTGESFTSIGGTFAFDFEEKPAAGGSPNSQYSFIVKALNSGIVPEPSSGLVWLILTGVAARRRRGIGSSATPRSELGGRRRNSRNTTLPAGRAPAAVAAVALVFAAGAATSAEAASTTYVLSNHPNGGVAPPHYGLRLDDLSGSGDFTFSFDPNDGADMRLVYDDVLGTIEISGTVYGGKDAGLAYDPNFVGFWSVAFTYSTNVVEVGNGLVVTPEDPSNNGTIEFVSGTGWSPGETFQLTDFRGGNANSFLLLSDGHRLSGDNSTIVGRGWVNHDGDGDLAKHNYASDWLFVATEVPPITPGGGIVPEPTAVVVWAGVLLAGRLRLTRAF